MDYDTAHLSELSPGMHVSYVTLTVDRVFIRENTTTIGHLPRQVKESECVDMICWDTQVNVVSVVLLKALLVLFFPLFP